MKYLKKKHSLELQQVLEYMLNVLGTEFPTVRFTSDYFAESLLDSARSNANSIIEHFVMDDNIEELKNYYVDNIKKSMKPIINLIANIDTNVEFDDELSTIFTQAEEEAKNLSSKVIGSEHMLLAILNPKNDISISEPLKKYGLYYDYVHDLCQAEDTFKNNEQTAVKPKELSIINNNTAKHEISLTDEVKPINDTSIQIPIFSRKQIGSDNSISEFTISINNMVKNKEVDPLIGREKEIEEVIKVIGRRKKNNAILIGKEGVGKTSIVYGLASMIEDGIAGDNLSDTEIVMLNVVALVSGTKLRGMLEERLKNLFRDLKAKKGQYILFIDNLQTVLKGSDKEKDSDLSDTLGNILSDGSVRIIATIGFKDYRNTVERNPSIARKFQKIVVEPETNKNSVLILEQNKKYYESYHNVVYSDEVIEHIVSMSERYINDRFLPDSAFDVLDLVGSSASLKNNKDETIISLRKKIKKIGEEKCECANNGEFEKIDNFILEENNLIRKINERRDKKYGERKSYSITNDDVDEVISKITNVPISKLSLKDKEKISNIDSILKRDIIGQDEAINEICRVIKRNKVGMGNGSRVMGSFLLCGPTGSGKTLLAKKLAEEIYGDKNALIRFDMSEYEDKTSVNKLIGASAGYIGYDNGGQLTEAVKNKPYSILLLDEIEKADISVYNIFLQLFDEGRLTDNAGQTIDFKNTIVIMTSNIGAKQASDFGNGIGFVNNADLNKKNIIKKSLKNQFSPEFLNRIDKIVYFNTLSEDNMREIVRLELDKLNKRMENIKYSIKYDDKVVDFIYKQAIKEKEYGARPIIRLIQDNIENKITDALLQKEYAPNYLFSITCKNEIIKIK